jgi:hypothetical protein
MTVRFGNAVYGKPGMLDMKIHAMGSMTVFYRRSGFSRELKYELASNSRLKPLLHGSGTV